MACQLKNYVEKKVNTIGERIRTVLCMELPMDKEWKRSIFRSIDYLVFGNVELIVLPGNLAESKLDFSGFVRRFFRQGKFKYNSIWHDFVMGFANRIFLGEYQVQ